VAENGKIVKKQKSELHVICFSTLIKVRKAKKQIAPSKVM
jgi:hypothetical protein